MQSESPLMQGVGRGVSLVEELLLLRTATKDLVGTICELVTAVAGFRGCVGEETKVGTASSAFLSNMAGQAELEPEKQIEKSTESREIETEVQKFHFGENCQ